MSEELLKEYQKKMVMFCIGIFILSATAAAIVFPLFKIFNLYSTVSWGIIAVFEAVVLIEDICGIILINKTKKGEFLSKKHEKLVKALLLTIQGLNLLLITVFSIKRIMGIFNIFFNRNSAVFRC